MHDDYDFTATFDFDDSEWKAIDDALALLEEKFAMLDEPVEEAEEGCFPFDPSAEAYTRRAIGELRKEWVHFVDDPWTDLDEIRGDLLSIDELRPRIGRLAALLDKCRHNEGWLARYLYLGCIDGYVAFDHAGRAAPMRALYDAIS